MRILALAAASLAMFVAAAKAHGRHLRLERELEGHFHVRFGAPNHPWVEALWHAERVRFWVLALLAAVALVVAARAHLARNVSLAAIAILLWAPTVSFVVTGALSARRLAIAAADPTKTGGGSLIDAARSDWMRAAVVGSVLWWAVVVGLVVLTAWAMSGVGAHHGDAPG